MRSVFRLGALVAPALVLVLIASGFVGSTSPARSQLAETPHGLPPGLLTPSAIWYRDVAQSLSPSELASYNGWVLSTNDSFETRILAIGHAPSYVNAADLRVAVRLSTSLNWWAVAGGIAAGCAVGALIGLAATPIASAAGCVLGGTAGGIIAFFAQKTGQDVSSSAELTIDQALVSDYDNFLNSSMSSLRTVLASNNATLDFLENQAAAAALTQIGNATWNAPLDMAQSGVAAELETDQAAFVSQWNGEASVFNSWGLANYGPNGRFSGTGIYENCINGLASLCNGRLNGVTSSDGGNGVGISIGVTTTNQSAFFPQGSAIMFICPAGFSGHFTNVVTTKSYTIPASSNLTLLNFTGGVWAYIASGSNQCNIQGTNGLTVATTVGGGGSDIVLDGCIASYDPCAYPGRTLYRVIGAPGFSPGVWQYSGSASQINGHAVTMPNLGLYLGNLEANAMLAGEAYWSFLRAQGITSISQIPSNCVIPYPSGALPQGTTNAIRNATAGQDIAIYLAWLNGLATFFNAAVNGTTFCQGHPLFKGAQLLPGPNGVNVTGFVYLVNATKYPHELFSNVTSWAINGTVNNQTRQKPVPMIIFPQTSTISIPVNTKFEVPSNDPIVALAPVGVLVYPAYYTLLGNGTPVNNTGGVVVDQSTPGAAIYLTSCTVGGVPQTNCTITLSNLQGYVAGINCPSGPNGCGLQSGTGGGLFGIPNPFSWLANFLGNLFGGGPFGMFLGGLFTAVLLVLIVGGLIYVSVVKLEEWGRRKRGGAPGGR